MMNPFTEASPILLTDFYKISHRPQYPAGTEFIQATWIPRSSYIKEIDKVVTFGFQAFVKEYLIDYFNENFFYRRWKDVQREYQWVISNTLGEASADAEHLHYLWNLQYLPILIKAVPEGTKVPLRVPMLTIENTDPKCFWLTNALETLFSCQNWQPATSATIAHRFREILDYWCEKTGGDPSVVPFQGHDFSMRGMSSVASAAASGAGHLLSFTGTDTIPAILFAAQYYRANLDEELVGSSIPATEHSVMCAYGRDELSSYRRLLTQVYPAGYFSVVSDTWDLWNVLTGVLPALKDEIMARDGKIIIRPDSGNPAEIICGPTPERLMWIEHDHENYSPAAKKGVIELLWDTFGGTINEKGYKVLDPHVGAIYGDAINLERCEDICRRLADKGFASTNMVYGIGSYSYQYQTRDTFGFALKSTWAMVNGEEINIYKDPVTDINHTKKSLTGRVVVIDNVDEGIIVIDGLDRAAEAKMSVAGEGVNMLTPIFHNGEVPPPQTFQEIRKRVA